jgi:hypothetical protein
MAPAVVALKTLRILGSAALSASASAFGRTPFAAGLWATAVGLESAPCFCTSETGGGAAAALFGGDDVPAGLASGAGAMTLGPCEPGGGAASFAAG